MVGYRTLKQVYQEIAVRAREPGFENRLDIYQLCNTLLYTLTGETIDGKEAVKHERVKEKIRKVQNNDLRLIIERMLSIDRRKGLLQRS